MAQKGLVITLLLCVVGVCCGHKVGVVEGEDRGANKYNNPYFSPKTYMDPSVPIPERIELLLAQMTLEEKVNQLLAPVSMDAQQLMETYKNTSVGSWIVNATANVTVRNQMQQFFVENSRLHIPVSFTQEGLHGGCNFGTIFPMPVAMTSSWNTDLIVEVHQAIAQEARACGADRSFSSNINVYTDPRFGRTQEGWGEDPFLVATMAAATVQGLQGTRDIDGYYNNTNSIVSEAKHFAAYGHTEAGQDGSRADISEATFREIYLAPWRAVIAAGVGALMPSHNEQFNGIPSHGNYWLLTEILREELNWQDGLVASDFGDIRGLMYYHLTATVEDAAIMALEAGVDQDLGAAAYPSLYNATMSGKVTMDLIDRSVRNVLRQKFTTGIFDTPYVDPAPYNNLDNPTNRQLARTIAQQSIVLLKNFNNTLPLDKTKYKSIALIGPNVDDWMAQTGGYTNYGAHIVTVLEGFQTYFENTGVDIQYAPGAFVMNDSDSLLPDAIKLATQSDIAILVVGDNQDTCEESWGGRTGDTPDLDIPGGQLQLIDAITKTGVTTVVVLISGRPATFGEDTENVILNEIHALVEAWRPGEEGGNAIVDILFGDVIPTGKIALTFPFSAGQIGGPVHPYYKKYRQYDGKIYSFQPSVPLFPFGFGLSYTTYEYSNLTVFPETIPSDGVVNINVDVKNTGSLDGEEIVQLYVQDVVASVVRYNMQLIGFQRVPISAGQTVTVSLQIEAQNLAFYNADMELLVEPGQFNVYVGPNSNQTLQSSFTVGLA